LAAELNRRRNTFNFGFNRRANRRDRQTRYGVSGASVFGALPWDYLGPAAPRTNVTLPEQEPLALAGWLSGPVLSAVTNFKPIAGIACRIERQPAGNATVVLIWLTRGVPTRRQVLSG
jgi:hypothetical protein